MIDRLANKVAIVTGGAGGLGAATVERFIAEGAKVVIAEIDEAKGQELASRLGSSATFKKVDVSKKDEVRALVQYAVDTFGRLDIMFNNAGISGARAPRFLDDELDDFHTVAGVNLLGVMLGTKFAAQQMIKSGGGAIINTASIAGLLAGYGVSTYRASKAGVIQFTKSVAIDLGSYGIRVNCIAPGHIATKLTARVEDGMSQETKQRVKAALDPVWLSNQAIKRRGRPTDIANAALFLASDEAAAITGIVLPVDSGVTAGDPVNHQEQLLDARAAALAG